MRSRLRVLLPLVLALIGGAHRAYAGDDIAAGLTAALATTEQREGTTSPYLLPLLEQLAQARFREGDLGAAAALRRRALDIAIGAFGCASASAAEAMAALAQSDIDRRRYLDAEPLLTIAETILSARVEDDHPAIAAMLAERARVALALGEPKLAEGWAARAVAIAAKDPHQRSTEALRALGAALAAEDRFEEGERRLREALDRDRETYGEDGLPTARSLSQLGNLYLRAKRYDEALPLIEQAAAIDQGRLGRNHPFIADDFYDLGVLYDALKRGEAARAALSFAVKLLEGGDGRDTPRLAYAESELVRILRARGKDAEADGLFHDARRILNKAEREEHNRERRV